MWQTEINIVLYHALVHLNLEFCGHLRNDIFSPCGAIIIIIYAQEFIMFSENKKERIFFFERGHLVI